jgi:hypothetical protein
LDEPSGLDVLKSLLQAIRGYKPAEPSAREPTLAKDVQCQVAECRAPSVFRCSYGWRFCAAHAKLHGMRGGRHTFELIARRTVGEIAAAEDIVRRRVDAGEGKEDYL